MARNIYAPAWRKWCCCYCNGCTVAPVVMIHFPVGGNSVSYSR